MRKKLSPGYKLIQVQSDGSDWKNFHEIQRVALFNETDSEYDVAFHESYFCRPARRFQLLMTFNDKPVGITTVDLISLNDAVSRGVAIAPEYQGKGHGIALGKLVQDFARSVGSTFLHVNADCNKTGFYEKLGFLAHEWDKTELNEAARRQIVQMSCKL